MQISNIKRTSIGRTNIRKTNIKRTNINKSRFDRFLPSFAIVPLIMLVLSNISVYYGARLLNAFLDRPYHDMSGIVDNAIPVIPGFAIIYLLAFPFWYISYFMICRSDPDKCRATVIVSVTAKLLCGLIFVMIPTTGPRPDVTGSGISGTLLGFIYAMDTPDNLFPSIHCFESVLCFLFINDEPKVHRSIKLSALVLAVLICLSTLFTKQHVLPDVLSGILLAVAAYFARRLLMSHSLRFFEKNNNRSSSLTQGAYCSSTLP
ncbi:MAG: phosphatase PAP2 family protein [Lachnospiraceae bacterium]|nr:phosphatase PAP2 family protein [Lachnospiraceae bacterium]